MFEEEIRGILFIGGAPARIDAWLVVDFVALYFGNDAIELRIINMTSYLGFLFVQKSITLKGQNLYIHRYQNVNSLSAQRSAHVSPTNLHTNRFRGCARHMTIYDQAPA